MKTINLNALFTLVLMLLATPQVAHADWMADPTSINSIFDTMAASTSHIAASLQAIGIKLFFSLALLQLVITGYGLIASGDIEQSVGKYARSFIWISFCVWLMSNNHAYNFLANTIQYFLDHAIGWASGTQANFDVGGIVATGITAVGNVYAAVATAAIPKSGGVSAIVSYFTSGGLLQAVYGVTVMIFTVLLIAATCLYLALKVFMVKIEAMIVLAIMPLSLSFLGLNALRDQGFAPFKSALALVYRIVILGAVTGGLAAASSAVAAYAIANPSATTLELGFCLSFGFVVLAFLAYKSDQIATSLANGSASMGSGDVAGAAMAAAAAAGAVTAGMGAVAGGAGSAEKRGMGDFMKSLLGGGGTISNASTRGAGKTPDPAPARPLASLNGASVGNRDFSSAPTRSSANSNGPTLPSAASTTESQLASASSSTGDAKGSNAENAGAETSTASPMASAVVTSSTENANGLASTPSAGSNADNAGPGTSIASPMASAGAAQSATKGNVDGLASAPPRTADNAEVSATDVAGQGTGAASPVASAGATNSAAISGIDTSMDPNAPKREKTSDKDKPPKRGDHKTSFGEHARNLGQQVASEKQATSVSINTHHE